MPLQPRYETEYYQPSCQPPCNVPTLYDVQPNNGTHNPYENIKPCPELICEDIYYPELNYEPIAPNITCCSEKPKKSLWQHLFGDRKSCFKKNCGCKSKKKQKCKPVQEVGCKPCPRQPQKSCKPVCQCTDDKYNCPRRGCFPTPKAVCGCHFYFNVENQPKKRKSPNRKANISINMPTDIDGEPNHVYEGLIMQSGEADNNLAVPYGHQRQRSTSPSDQRKSRRSSPEYNYSNNNGSERKSIRNSSTRRNSTPCKTPSPGRGSPGSIRKVCKMVRGGTEEFSPSLPRKSDAYRYTTQCVATSSSQDDIHIGVTLTKEEVRYYRANQKDSTHPVFEDVKNSERKNVMTDESNDSSDKILTLEINKNSLKDNQNKNTVENNENDEVMPNDFYRQSKIPNSESFKRELEPLLIKKKRTSDRISSSMNNTDNSSFAIEGIQFRPTSMSRPRKKSTTNNLDKRVSEILKKLHNIEEKINDIEKKQKGNKDIRIDFDEQKSTVSFHFNGVENNKCEDNNDSGDSLNKSKSKATVIEIRRDKSKPRSSARKTSLQPVSDPSNPHCMNFGKKNKPKPKIVIKLPNNMTNTNKRCITIPNDDSPMNQNIVKTPSVTWCQVADNLKLNSPNGKCYCLACQCKEN